MSTDYETLEQTARQLRELGPGLLRANGAGPPAAWAEALGRLEALLAQARAYEAALDQRQERLDALMTDLREQQATHWQLIEFALDAYLVTDLRGVIREANQGAAELLRCRKEFLVDKPLGLFVAESWRLAFYSALARLNRGEADTVRGWELELHRARTLPRHVAVTVSAVAGSEGRAVALRWLLRDVTTRIRAESALHAERTLAAGLFDTAQAIILVVDVRGHVVRVNRFTCTLTGYDESELRGRDWRVLLPAGERRRALEWLGRGPPEASQHWQGQLVRRAGEPRSVVWSAKPLPGADPLDSLVLILGHDVTQLEQAQRQALQAERLAAIGQVMASLAHESRNALQRGTACLERLAWRLEGRSDELTLLGKARAAQDDLTRLFEEVRGYAAPLRLELGACHLAAIWREAWQQVRDAHPQREAYLQERGVSELWCTADRFRLGQLFRNLLENALAACPDPARVVILTEEATAPDGNAALRVRVGDNGPGLGTGPSAMLFEPFYTTKVHGTGLGLAIARRVAEAHGGTLTAGAGPEGGAEFILTLPRNPP